MIVTVACSILGVEAAAQTTPYVPNLDPAYEDLDALASLGLVPEMFAGERPYSRAEFGRLTRMARSRLDRSGGVAPPARFLEALERLEARFANGNADRIGDSPPGAPSGRLTGVRARPSRIDLTLARSPERSMRTGYGFVGDTSVVERIDGDLNPLLQRNQGRVLADGLTLGLEGTLEGAPASWLAVQARPRVWLAASRPGSGDRRFDVTSLEAYARGGVGPVALEVGRNHLAFGFGPLGGPFLSHNARGLDMVRLSLDRPLRLPGFLRGVGSFKATTLAADMGGDRDVRHSKLFVTRVGWKPVEHLEFGIMSLSHQRGEVDLRRKDGRPRKWHQYVKDAYFLFLGGARGQFSDKVMGGDIQLTLPALGTVVYVNGLTTDDRDYFRQPAGGLWEDAIWVVGFKSRGLGPERRLDAAAEWRHSGATPHTHGQYSSGLTLDRRVLGDYMGPLGAGVALSLSWRGTGGDVEFIGSWERYSGDDWLVGPDEEGLWDWGRTSDNADENRLRGELSWRRRGTGPYGGVVVRLGYEHVTRFAFTDRSRNNAVLQVRWVFP